MIPAQPSDLPLNLRLGKLEAFINNSTSAIVITKASSSSPLHGEIVFANQAFTKLTGYLPEQAQGKALHMLQGAKTASTETDRIKQALGKNQSVKASLICYAQDQKEFWADMEIFPIPDDSKGISHFIHILRDISKRKALEEKYSRRSQMTRLLTVIATKFVNLQKHHLREEIQNLLLRIGEFTHSDRSFVLMIDPVNSVLNLGGEWCAVGHPPRHTLLQNVPLTRLSRTLQKMRSGLILKIQSVDDLDDIPPDEKQFFRDRAMDCFLFMPMLFQNELLGIIALERHVESSQWEDIDTDLVQIVAEILTAAHKRKEAENELKISEQRYLSVLSSMSEGVVIHDTDGVIQFCNSSAEKIMAMPMGEMRGLSSADFKNRTFHEDGSPFPPYQHPSIVTLRSGKPCENVIMGMKVTPENMRWLSVNSRPIRGVEDDSYQGVVVTFVDITELKRAQEILAREAQLMMLRYQINPHFLFNTLNSILAEVPHENRVVTSMITNLAEYLRYSLKEGEKSRVPLRVEVDAIKSYLEIEKVRFDETIQFSLQIDPTAADFELPPFLLQPLVENAIKYGKLTSPRPLQITIRSHMTPLSFVLEVENTGRWVPKGDNPMPSLGIGLTNVTERLKFFYNQNAELTVWEDELTVSSKIEIKRI
ncbi:MAG: PAS domain-containing protein [Verrucomicrobiae bacterium]|nr:PAS domain-containing protein [Verrucomicrobiae bacterium]